MTAPRKGDYIQTFTGRKFWPVDPRPEDVDIVDIAHALSNQCRFSGHTKEFISVAQHSFHVSYACHPQDALYGLLHDAAEAYVIDFPRPIKMLPEFSFYREIESRVMRAICERFGLRYPMPTSVKRADDILLAAEARALMNPDCEWNRWIDQIPPWNGTINPWTPGYAKHSFLHRFKQLYGADE